eukprot:scaffold180_cov311-Pinguiococcus_pyrenoidosus.AAC.11
MSPLFRRLSCRFSRGALSCFSRHFGAAMSLASASLAPSCITDYTAAQSDYQLWEERVHNQREKLSSLEKHKAHLRDDDSLGVAPALQAHQWSRRLNLERQLLTLQNKVSFGGNSGTPQYAQSSGPLKVGDGRAVQQYLEFTLQCRKAEKERPVDCAEGPTDSFPRHADSAAARGGGGGSGGFPAQGRAGALGRHSGKTRGEG